MIETMVPKDIRVYETKIIGPLTARNAIAVFIAFTLDYFLWKFAIKPFEISINLAMYIMIIIDVPILAIGFIKVQGVTFDIYIKSYIRNVFILPKNRKAQNIIIEQKKKENIDSKQKKAIEKNNIAYMKKHNIISSK